MPRIPFAGNEQEITNDFIARSRPVIITGLASKWPCVTKWTPGYLRERYGEDPILITHDVARGAAPEGADARLKDIIDSLESGDSTKYARFSDLLHRHPELIQDIDWELLNRLKQRFSSRSPELQIFIGAKGTSTSLHAACSHNLFVQVHGSKHWYIASAYQDPALRPIVNRSPFFVSPVNPAARHDLADPVVQYVDHYDFELHPGEILFNPSSFWHQVTNLSGSIGFGFRWVSLDAFRINMTQALMVLSSTNPPFLFVNRKNSAKFFKRYAGQQQGGFVRSAG